VAESTLKPGQINPRDLCIKEFQDAW